MRKARGAEGRLGGCSMTHRLRVLLDAVVEDVLGGVGWSMSPYAALSRWQLATRTGAHGDYNANEHDSQSRDWSNHYNGWLIHSPTDSYIRGARWRTAALRRIFHVR